MTDATTAPADGIVVRGAGGRVLVPGNRWDLAPPAPLRTVSVVIPYYESPADLVRLLAGVDAQTVTPHEVIVVDDGSQRDPARAVLADRDDVIVRWQTDEGVRPAAARNLGASVATGDVLAFLDGDVVPHPTCLQHLAALSSALPDALVVGRRQHADLEGLDPDGVLRLIEDPRSAPDRWLDDMGWLADAYERTGDLRHIDVRGWRYVISAVMAIDRSLLLELGGFDATRAGYGGEDWELAHRALHAGAVLAHAPDAVVVHNGADLAGRQDAVALKTAETLWLLPRVSDRTFRPAGLLAACPRVVVVLQDEGWDDATLLRCVDAWLAAVGDVVVHLTGRDQVPIWGRSDPRVRVGNPPTGTAAAVPGGPMAHVEVRCDVRTPVLIEDEVRTLLARTDPGGVDRVIVHDGRGAELLTVTAARTAARIDRAATHPQQVRSLWAAVGTTLRIPAEGSGVRRLPPVTDLEGSLDRPDA